MPVDNTDLNDLLMKATKQPVVKPKIKLSIWKRMIISIKLKYIIFKESLK